MSLFGQGRQKVPLLTQFYQLEFDHQHFQGSELEAWLTEMNGGNPIIVFSQADRTDRQVQNAYTMVLGSISRLYSLARRIMDSVVDNGGIQYGDLQQLNEDGKRRPQNIILGQPNDDQLVPTHSLVFTATMSGSIADKTEVEVRQELEDALKREVETPGVLRRCPECSSVYACVRSDQVFCSDRCRTRQHARETQRRKRHPNAEINV